MSATSGSPNRLHQLVDAVVYALSVTAVVFAVALVLSALFSDDVSEGVVYLTFVSGFAIFGYGTLRLRPSAAWKKERAGEAEEDVKLARTDTDDRGESIGQTERSQFQAAVQRVPPLRWYSLPPDQRLSPGTKIFLSGVAVLVGSLATDVVFHGAFG